MIRNKKNINDIKTDYIKPYIEVVDFSVDDIIRTSGEYGCPTKCDFDA